MPDAPAVPQFAPPPDAGGPGSLFETYDPQGALGGLFAPAYIRGFQPSEQAVSQWQAQQRPVSSQMVDELRMPNLWSPPQPNILKDGVYGKGVPASQSYGDPLGMVDQNALRAAAMGGAYDVQGRRDAIAARLAENTMRQAAPMPATTKKAPKTGYVYMPPDETHPSGQWVLGAQ